MIHPGMTKNQILKTLFPWPQQGASSWQQQQQVTYQPQQKTQEQSKTWKQNLCKYVFEG